MNEESGERMDDVLLAARLAAIVDSSDDIIVSKTLDGIITSWNRGAERIFGWTAAEAIGRHITLIIPEELRAEENVVLARIRRGERIDHFETVRKAKDGRRIDVSLSISPIRDRTGRIVGASKIGRDITERRNAEVAQARLAALVDSSDDVIVSKTLDGVITSWNGAAERVFGWTAAEAIGRHITLIVPEDRRAEEDEVLARIRRGERVDHFETVRRTKDGRLLDLSITVSPVKDGSGRIVGASKIARDISERRRIERERATLLASEQAARQHAETLIRTKDELLATVSHELRTPLNSIFGWARMMQSSEMDDAGRMRAINAIIRNVSALGRLVEDLLDLSRIVTGRMRLDFQHLDIMTVVEAAIETVRPAASAKAISLTIAADGGARTMIHGAPDRLQQVMWNLLMNAVKFTPAGGRVDVGVRRAGPALEVCVTDTGEGIPPDLLPYVFDPFRQGDSSSTRTHGGLGLGLALVRDLVELHGGSVRAESAGKGAGATFTVTLPLAQSTPPGRSRAREDPAVDKSAEAPLDGVNVLVVDDDLEFLELAAVMLRQTGAEVRTAVSVYGAHDVVKSWKPDVVVTDLAMPAQDGFLLLGTMRTMFSERVPVVAVTANATPENRARVEQAGFDLCLAKPIDPLDLIGAIARVLAGAR